MANSRHLQLLQQGCPWETRTPSCLQEYLGRTIGGLARLDNGKRDRRDLEIINRNAGRLNREAMDTLQYQMSTKARRHQRPSA